MAQALICGDSGEEEGGTQLYCEQRKGLHGAGVLQTTAMILWLLAASWAVWTANCSISGPFLAARSSTALCWG